jgi:glycyl-tRNA synthetase alpha chain
MLQYIRMNIAPSFQGISFQDIIFRLQTFWHKQGCAILQPYDLEVGAGTFHPATVLRCLTDNEWNVAYIQPSRRPVDSRFGDHPNRMQHYYQFQVILKPSPDNIQNLYLESLNEIGIDYKKHDIRFVEDDWESPTIGASGLGWEIWLNGMEVSQFTYMQQIGGIEISPVPGEITYGLERLAMYVQDVSDYKDLRWNDSNNSKCYTEKSSSVARKMSGELAEPTLVGEHKQIPKSDNANGEVSKVYTYKDMDLDAEKQFSAYNLYYADTDMLLRHFSDYETQCSYLVNKDLPIPAYDFCAKASHIFNLLNARGVISVTERANYVSRVRNMAKACCTKMLLQKDG